MSFGISPKPDRTQMIGSDVVVAWVDQDTGKGFAQDYYLDDKSQCSGGRGTCPDVNIEVIFQCQTHTYVVAQNFWSYPCSHTLFICQSICMYFDLTLLFYSNTK